METLRDLPLNGMRYMPTAGGSGWYIWGGETKSDSADFFTAIQVRDVGDYLPTIQPGNAFAWLSTCDAGPSSDREPGPIPVNCE